MQYPYAVAISEGERTRRYIVMANDIGQARRRGQRRHQEDGGQGPGTVQRAVSLAPAQRGGKFYPRVDGCAAGGPCETPQEAVEAALLFLDGQGARS